MIEKLILEILALEHPAVYDVTLQKMDHRISWTAWANLRADHRNFAVESDTPEHALQELLKVLQSTICPHCHQIMPEKS